jgi:hypothetical protein
MPLAPILRLHRGHPHHAPHGALARVVAPQHPEQLADIQGIRLRSPEPSIHFDARRVHHHVRDPAGDQVPVPPEPVAARLVAAPHRGGDLHAEPLLGVGDLSGQPLEIARRHRSHAWRGPGLGREPELPLMAPQLEGEVQAQRGRSGILSAGRVALVIVGSSLPRFG